jgi:S-methylmethionine-dependent homocysteine/selenocysteine methylase
MTTIEQHKRRLAALSVGELRIEYESVFGEINNSRHKEYLIKRILWKIQANQYGGLSKKSLVKASQLADISELRLTAPASQTICRPVSFSVTAPQSELRAGTQLERMYKGQRIVVMVMDNGVRFNGKLYRSLSAVAKDITGTHTSGKLFFGLTKRKAN